MQIVIKKIDAPMQLVNVSCKYLCELKQLFLNKGCAQTVTLQYVPINKNIMLVVDEAGYLKNLSHNFFIKSSNKDFPIQTIIGTAIFARVKPLPCCGEIYDYEIDSLSDKVDSLSDKDNALIAQILSIDNQNYLSKRFNEVFGEGKREYWSVIIRKLI